MKYSIEFINKTINKVKSLLDDNNINYYIVGAIGAYIDANLSISRIHDDLDIMIEEKYIDKLKSIFSDNDFKFYDNRLKSNKVLNEFGYADGDHEVYVTCDNFHIGFILYEITDDSYSFIDYLRTISGIHDIVPDDILKYLKKMELDGKVLNEKEIEVTAPITRSDILHQCDIAEDLAISYGSLFSFLAAFSILSSPSSASDSKCPTSVIFMTCFNEYPFSFRTLLKESINT